MTFCCWNCIPFRGVPLVYWVTYRCISSNASLFSRMVLMTSRIRKLTSTMGGPQQTTTTTQTTTAITSHHNNHNHKHNHNHNHNNHNHGIEGLHRQIPMMSKRKKKRRSDFLIPSFRVWVSPHVIWIFRGDDLCTSFSLFLRSTADTCTCFNEPLVTGSRFAGVFASVYGGF